MPESFDINTGNYLPYTIRLPTFDQALMMKSKTSKVAMKPSAKVSWGLLFIPRIIPQIHFGPS
jgi:hypothetical protein